MFSQMIKGLMVLVLLTACQGQTKEAMVQEGMALVKAGNPLGAVVLFNSALEKDPNYVEARYQLGLAYLKGGKLDRAEKELQKVRLQDPGNGEVILDMASLYLSMQKIDEAEEELRQYLDKQPKSSRSQEYLGRVTAVRGDLPAAEQLFKEAAELDAGNAEARLALAQLYLQLGWSDQAQAELASVIKAFPDRKAAYFMVASLEGRQGRKAQALEAYRQVTRIDGEDIAALYMTGMLSLDMGDAAEAQRIADHLRKRYPKHPSGSRLLGLIRYAAGDFENAALELRASLQGMPDLAGYYFLGLAEYRRGSFELALSQFQRALDIQPEHLQARLMVGMTLLRQERIDDSIHQVKQVLAVNDQIAMAHNVLGSAYLAKKEFDKAMPHLDRAIALDPSLADVHMKKGLFNLAQGDRQGAELELEKAVEAAPEALNTRFLLASLYLRQQNYRGAIETLQAGLDGTEEDALLYNYMAAAYLAQKQNEQGLESLNKAKQAKSDYLTPYFNLANFYLANQQRDKAMEEYRAILQIAPENVKALISLGSLQEIEGDAAAAKTSYQKARDTSAPEGFLALAGYLGRSRQGEEAAKVIEAAYQAHPEHPAILETRGKLLLGQKNTAEAVKMFQALDKVNPGAGLPLLAVAWLADGEQEKALALAKARIDEQPTSASGYLLQAAIHQRLGEVDKAEAALTQGLARAKDAPLLSLQLGSLYAGSGRVPKALETFAGLRKAQPDFVPAIFALGALYDQQGDKGKAVEFYKEVLAKAEDYTAALNNLAYLYADNYGSPEEALVLAVKAFRNEPGNPGILDTLGLALLKNGRHEEAVNVLNKAAEILPKVAAVRLHQGQALHGAGKQAAAREALQAAIALGPGPEAEQARKLLDEIKD